MLRDLRAGAYVAWFISMVVLVGFLLYQEAQKVETPPFWSSCSQYEWERQHQVPCVGVDETSQAIIDYLGAHHCAWKKEIVCFEFNTALCQEWYGAKVLLRYRDGKIGLNDVNLHPPLTKDPYVAKTPLHECLAASDDGTPLPSAEKPRGIMDLIKLVPVPQLK